MLITIFFTLLASLDSALGMAQIEKAIDFIPHTAQPQPPVPIDLRNTLFGSIEDVQTATLPKPQLPSVISSYEKTIGKLFVLFESQI